MTHEDFAKIPARVFDTIANDPRITQVRVYLDGWLPNAYNWPAPGRVLIANRNDGAWVWGEYKYDRKRSFAAGPRWVAFSERGGRLASEPAERRLF